MTANPVIAVVIRGAVDAAVASPGGPVRSAPLLADGTAALDSLAGQAVGWGLAVAVAMVVICAAGWAVGSLSSHPQVAARAKAGIVVAMAGALLLGASAGYLAWLGNGQAQAFTADPASYKAETAAPQPGIEVVSKTSDWIVAVNHYRQSTPADPVAPDAALEALAASCAAELAGGTGICPDAGQYYAVKLSPSQVATLSGPLSPDTLQTDAPALTSDISKVTNDPRIAIVGARNTHNGTAQLVFMFSAGPCKAPCTPKSDGAIMPGLVTHVVMGG
ncbi:MAG: hypothetical protein BGO26_01070 [Actinobacteria bacterium 69-20]|nr:hypothetical protein [Actinomycetota bacterium]OJV28595.1 MAG: hypothetical protein BGO26_01070 [Actinobacteria bacterium 69-20]